MLFNIHKLLVCGFTCCKLSVAIVSFPYMLLLSYLSNSQRVCCQGRGKTWDHRIRSKKLTWDTRRRAKRYRCNLVVENVLYFDFRKINSSNTGWERPALFAVRVNQEPRAHWVQVHCPYSRSSPGPHYCKSHVHRKGGESPFLCVAQLTARLSCLALGIKTQKGLEQIQQNEFKIWDAYQNHKSEQWYNIQSRRGHSEIITPVDSWSGWNWYNLSGGHLDMDQNL